MPWSYVKQAAVYNGNNNNSKRFYHQQTETLHLPWESLFVVATIVGLFVSLLLVFVRRDRNLRKLYDYEPIKEVEVEEIHP
jgi:hypothetical protein